MNLERIIDLIYLSVSLLSLLVHTQIAWALHGAKAKGVLVRTTACRVICAVLYTAVGTNAVFWRWSIATVTIAVYTITSAIWMVNGRIDKRLGAPRRRRRWPIMIQFGFPPEDPEDPGDAEAFTARHRRNTAHP